MTTRDRIQPFAKCIGTVIQRHRKQRGMQIQQLARRVDLTRQHLAILERGENVPSLETLFNLAEVFGVRPSQLLAEIEAEWFAPKQP